MCELSIIVPIYKTEKFLRDCIDSIIVNLKENMELILVDDGSPDNCGKICDSYAKNDSRIIVLHNENGGMSSARNAGLDIAHGDYLAFVDSDDMIDSMMFSKMLDQIKDREADIVCCGMVILDSGVPYMDFLTWHDFYTYEDNIELVLYRNSPGDFYMNKIFKRELFNNLRLPLGKYYEDTYLMYQIFDRADKVVCIKEPLYLYRLHGQSISHSAEFNPKIMDYAYACKEEWQYVKLYRNKYTELATAKYANAINQLSKKPAIIYGNSEEAKKCFGILRELFLQDIVSIENNTYCSERLKHEISLMLKGKASLKRYMKKMEYYKRFHNHPSMQNKIVQLLSIPKLKEPNSYQY